MTTVKTLLTLSLVVTTRIATADESVPEPAPAAPAAAPPVPAIAPDAHPEQSLVAPTVHDAPPAHALAKPEARLLHGFRIGGMVITNFDKESRKNDDGTMTSLKDEFELTSKYMMLIGYEGMYRIMSRSWLNVILVGNVTVAGLEQSRFIPAASGLIGAEFNQSFQLGIGVNLTPDEEAPSHMIAAAGWTPKVGTIYTPIHFFIVPDPINHNTRVGTTVGVSW